MKKLALIMLLIGFVVQGWCQETFRKEYKIPTIILLKGKDSVFLKKDSVVNFKNLTTSEIKVVEKEYELGKLVSITKEIQFSGDKVTLTKEIIADTAFYAGLSKTRTTNVDTVYKKIRGYVKFDEDGKIIVNPNLILDSTRSFINRNTYYYKLKNRQAIRLAFSEWNVSALTLPIKYRFKSKESLAEEFSTAVNGNVFLGYSIGQTSFFYRDKVGNKSNTWKVTAGILFGASSVTLNSSNTSNAPIPILNDVEIVKGLGSLGMGITFTFNKINFGTFYGYDYVIGKDSGKWNYNKKPWLGIAIGYSLLSF